MSPIARSLAAAEGIRKLPRVEESSRGYTKAPEGRRDKATFRRASDDQDDQRPTGFDRLLFLNMFKISSGSLFSVPDSRRTGAIAPDLSRPP